MECPYCKQAIAADSEECPGCQLVFARVGKVLGILPWIHPGLSDCDGWIKERDAKVIQACVARLEARFSGLVVQVMVRDFPENHPLSIYAFWVFNASAFGGVASTGGANRAIFLLVAPERGEAVILPGYGLEALMEREALEDLLHQASEAWRLEHWALGIMNVLNGLEKLLEAVAVPDSVHERVEGEF